MQISWKKSHSSVKPKDVDYESSPTTVYVHKNIVETETENGIVYECDEAKMTPEIYQLYSADENRKLMESILEKMN